MNWFVYAQCSVKFSVNETSSKERVIWTKSKCCADDSIAEYL